MSSSQLSERSKIEQYWSKKSTTQIIGRWWQSQSIIRHINQQVCGSPVDGPSQGLIELLKQRCQEREFPLPIKRAISVGGGQGIKEMMLVEQGIVQSIDIYEFSQARITEGRAIAERKQISDRVRFVYGDAFELVTEAETYDMVHWNNALHHMFDVFDAVKWSRHILKEGGIFYMDDFVGANRFQWSEDQLEYSSKVRAAFIGTDYLQDPLLPDKVLATSIKAPNPQRIIDQDPSESVDCERILAAVEHYFPKAEIKKTGGAIYHLALSQMLHNFQKPEDQPYMNLMMIVDELLAKLGHTHYAVALGFKEASDFDA